MSKNRNKQPGGIDQNTQRTATADAGGGFRIPYPVFLLVAAVLLVYLPSLSLGFTELDDTIFIKEFRAFNEDTSNLIAAFSRGLFDAVKDPYYRPLFSDAMILNYQVSGEEPFGYHLVNVLLHMGVVVMLYRLLLRLGVTVTNSFYLSVIFAVHPVLTQAVTWIPGRNDTLLALFVVPFLSQSLMYAESGKAKSLLLSGLLLLLAFFTKETAVFAAPAAFFLLVLYKGVRWNDKNMLVQYGVWACCFLVWYAARSAATIQASGIGSAAGFSDMLHRLPVIIQYIGKIMLPVNQSVFPTQEDTVVYFGLMGIALLGALIALSSNRSTDSFKALAGAFGIFLLFLMPALLVPAALNQQTFEHRLYLPAIGIVLALPHTALLNNRFSEKQRAMVIGVLCGVLALLNVRHQHNFSDPLTFWTSAAETSPNSAYANMMLAARLDKTEHVRSEQLFRKAYKLNPKEKYLNFYMAEMLQRKDSVMASEAYLLEEKKISDYVQCDFLLARVAMEKKDLKASIGYLERYLQRDPYNPMAHNNLLLLYVDTQQPDKARNLIRSMQQKGMEVPAPLRAKLGM
ncbi:MAG: glycosyltransferase family 39 protein [Flavipsychrobacter sp.]|nr:glycosyltransferase family 39 protein [Flavipsychrobacter sp.]